MKQQFIAMALLLSGFVGCNTAPEPLKIDNALTAEEVATARLTPEVMWKMSRIGEHALSPDGGTLLYTLTRYNMEENRGVTVIVSRDLATGKECELTDTSSNSMSPVWSIDGADIWFVAYLNISLHYFHNTHQLCPYLFLKDRSLSVINVQKRGYIANSSLRTLPCPLRK